MILDVARGQTMKRARHLQHPLFCLDAIRIGVEQGGVAGLKAVSHLDPPRPPFPQPNTRQHTDTQRNAIITLEVGQGPPAFCSRYIQTPQSKLRAAACAAPSQQLTLTLHDVRVAMACGSGISNLLSSFVSRLMCHPLMYSSSLQTMLVNTILLCKIT